MKKTKCHKCSQMLTCIFYEFGEQEQCDYKPHKNLLCQIFGHKYGKTIYHDKIVDLTKSFRTGKRTKHIYFYQCKRCGWMKFLDDFKELKILNRPK